VVNSTLLYCVGTTLCQYLVGLGDALLLNQSMRLKAATRSIIYLPVIISPLIMGYIWYFFFAYQGGALNDVLMCLGFDAINILSNPDVNAWLIVLINTYQFVWVAMIIYIAGLHCILIYFYEAD